MDWTGFVGLSTNPNLQLALSGLDYCHTRTIVGEGSFSVCQFFKILPNYRNPYSIAFMELSLT